MPVLAALLASACAPTASPDGNDASATPTAAQQQPAPTPPPPPPAASAQAVALTDTSDLLVYAYSWPAEAAAIPTLDARLRADARTFRQRALNGARADRKSRKGQDFPFHAHDATRKWTVEGEAGGLLALRDEFYTFTGGAHGMSGFQFILWDRAADRDIAVKDLFADWPRARAELVRLFCPALDRQRAEKRGGPVDRSDEMFGRCPDLEKQVLIPSDVRGGAFTSIRVLIGPYEAGPYAEGSYDVPLPVTPALVALLKPERKDVLAAR